MPASLAPGRREAIEADLRDGMSARQVARKHGVSQSTASRTAKAAGIKLDRSATKIATAAHQADHAAVLIKLAARSAAVAGDILASFEAMDLDDWGKVSPHTRSIAFGICSDKARELAPPDDEAQNEAARSLLTAVLDGMVAKHGPA